MKKLITVIAIITTTIFANNTRPALTLAETGYNPKEVYLYNLASPVGNKRALYLGGFQPAQDIDMAIYAQQTNSLVSLYDSNGIGAKIALNLGANNNKKSSIALFGHTSQFLYEKYPGDITTERANRLTDLEKDLFIFHEHSNFGIAGSEEYQLNNKLIKRITVHSGLKNSVFFSDYDSQYKEKSLAFLGLELPILENVGSLTLQHLFPLEPADRFTFSGIEYCSPFISIGLDLSLGFRISQVYFNYNQESKTTTLFGFEIKYL